MRTLCLNTHGKDGETCVVVVSNSIKDGKSTEDYPYGEIAWSDHRYRRCERVGRFRSNRYF